MNKFDSVIVGGTIVTASDNFNIDISINNSKFSVIADRLEGDQHTINAEGRYVFTGGKNLLLVNSESGSCS